MDWPNSNSEEVKRRTKCLLRGGQAGTQEHARKRGTVRGYSGGKRNAQKQKAQQHMQQHAISFVEKKRRCAPNPRAATPAPAPLKKSPPKKLGALPRRENLPSSVGNRPSFYFNSLIVHPEVAGRWLSQPERQTDQKTAVSPALAPKTQFFSRPRVQLLARPIAGPPFPNPRLPPWHQPELIPVKLSADSALSAQQC